MIDRDLWQGELVRLVAEDPEAVVERFYAWNRDTEYWRLLSDTPAMPYSKAQIKAFVEKDLTSERQDLFFFLIRSLDGDRTIGEIGFDGVDWVHGDTFVGISIGERDLWGKGYGTDAMRVILRFAFTELNLRRVSLNTFEYNPRAIRSYQKAGFVIEGRERGAMLREGRRWDVVYMGVLREEWQHDHH